MGELISRLGTSQTKVARDFGISSNAAFSQWLNGKNTLSHIVGRAGAKAMEWYEANKSRQTSPQQQPPLPYKPADAKRARSSPLHFVLKLLRKTNPLHTNLRVHYQSLSGIGKFTSGGGPHVATRHFTVKDRPGLRHEPPAGFVSVAERQQDPHAWRRSCWGQGDAVVRSKQVETAATTTTAAGTTALQTGGC